MPANCRLRASASAVSAVPVSIRQYSPSWPMSTASPWPTSSTVTVVGLSASSSASGASSGTPNAAYSCVQVGTPVAPAGKLYHKGEHGQRQHRQGR